MKIIMKILVYLICSFLLYSCGKQNINIGNNRLTIDLKYKGKPLDAQGRIYINDKFIGMTSEKGDMSIKLQKGEYNIRVDLDGYDTWQETVLLIGKGYSQYVAPEMRKLTAGGVP